jgi:ankyrin repeat protein
MAQCGIGYYMSLNGLKHNVLDHGALSKKDNTGDTPLRMAEKLCIAAGNYDIDMIYTLTDAKVDVNAEDMYGDTPLIHAIYSSGRQMPEPDLSRAKQTVDLLLHLGADLSKMDKEGDTPLRMAAMLESPLTFMLLVEAVIAPDDADEMHYLIENGLFDKDSMDPYYGTALCCCAALYSSGTALVLLAAGAMVNAVGTRGRTPLHYAIATRNPRYSSARSFYSNASLAVDNMVKLLLYYGAGDVQDDMGNTPLHEAAMVNEPFITKNLIEHGAWRHLKTKNSVGYTAQDLAMDNQKKMAEWYTVPAMGVPSPDRGHYQRMRALEHKGHDAVDFKVPVEISNDDTYQNMRRTIQVLNGARSVYDQYSKDIAYAPPEDIERRLPLQFRPHNFVRSDARVRSFEHMFKAGWIRSIEGIVRRILYPNNDIPSFLIPEDSSPSSSDEEWQPRGVSPQYTRGQRHDKQQVRQRTSLAPGRAILWYDHARKSRR